MLKYGTLTPACFYPYIDSDGYPDICKFYTAMPTRSTESSAANQRRPVLYGSLNGGVRWCYESQSSGFYPVNYGGNFYFNSPKYHLEAWAHKSTSSSYGAYKAVCGNTNTKTDIKLSNQGWSTSAVVPYNTANQPNREICKNLNSTSYYGRYFCIKDGGGYAYNDDPWSTVNWSTTSFGLSGVTLTDDGGFKHICMNPEDDHSALVFFVTNDSNKYLRIYYCNTDTVSMVKDYTVTVWEDDVTKQSNYKYVSIDYLPGVGFLIFYIYYSGWNVPSEFRVRILRTYDPVTGEKLPSNQFVRTDSAQYIGSSDNAMVQYGSHGWYCPWTKEYFFAPNAYQVFWTKDGIHWDSSAVTGASSSTACQKFLTDGQNIIVATSGSAYYYSRSKGQGWVSDVTLSPNGFNTNRSNDTIVLPFKCENNIGINTSDLTLGKAIDRTTGAVVDSSTNFYLNGFIPVDPSTSYVFYGSCKTPYSNIAEKQKTFFNRILYYDSSYNYISGKEGADYTTGGTPNREVPCIFTSPANAAYAKVTCNINNTNVTQTLVDSYKWYFAKESDFKVMTEYGDIVVN